MLINSSQFWRALRTKTPRDRAFSIALPNHRLQYQPGGDTLIVAFDNAGRPAAEPYEGRSTWGEDFYIGEGHSLLGVIAKSADWYRDNDLIHTLEALRWRGFFKRFSKVVFTGGSMGGFAALAFCSLAKGSTVIAFSPQSTLNPKFVPWEDRFKEGSAKNWLLKYSDAASCVRYAKTCYILYDGLDSLDRMHASRFPVSENVHHLRLPGGGHGISPLLARMRVLKTVTREMISGELIVSDFPKMMRVRRKTAMYRKNLVSLAMDRRRFKLAEVVCNSSITEYPRAGFYVLRRAARVAHSEEIKQRAAERKRKLMKDPANSTDQPHPLDSHFPNLRRNIFIITYGRSGSTLLQNLLMTIPGCEMRGENHNIMESVWHAAIRCRIARNTWGAKQVSETHPWYGADQMKPMMFARGMLDSFVKNVLCPSKDSRYFGFKEIRYNVFDDRLSEVLDFMRFHFKDAFFVFNTRNVDSVAQSAWWKDWNRDDVVSLVQNMDRRFAEYHAAHPDYTALLSYEDFSSNTLALRPFFAKLGEPFDEERIKAVLSNRLGH